MLIQKRAADQGQGTASTVVASERVHRDRHHLLHDGLVLRREREGGESRTGGRRPFRLSGELCEQGVGVKVQQRKRVIDGTRVLRQDRREFLRGYQLGELDEQLSPPRRDVLALQSVEGRQEHEGGLVVAGPGETECVLVAQRAQHLEPLVAVEDLIGAADLRVVANDDRWIAILASDVAPELLETLYGMRLAFDGCGRSFSSGTLISWSGFSDDEVLTVCGTLLLRGDGFEVGVGHGQCRRDLAVPTDYVAQLT